MAPAYLSGRAAIGSSTTHGCRRIVHRSLDVPAERRPGRRRGSRRDEWRGGIAAGGLPGDPPDRRRSGIAVAGSAAVHAGRRDGRRRGRRGRSAEAGPGGMPIAIGSRALRRSTSSGARTDTTSLLPVCTERLEDFLLRRAGGAELAVGEAVTLAVSLLRGIGGAVGDGTRRRAASWWLTEAGDRSSATDTGDRTVGRADGEPACDRSLPRSPSLARILEDAARGADRPAPPRARARARRGGALRASPIRSRSPRPTFGPQARRVFAASGRRPGRMTTEPDAGPDRRGCTRCHAISMRTGRISSRGPRPGSGALCARRAPGAGGPGSSREGWPAWSSIGGLLWPTAAGGPATAGVPADAAGRHRPRARASASPEPVVDRPGRGRAAEAADLAVIAADLLSARTECASDQACLEQVVEVARCVRSPAASSIWPPRSAP